jgi:16S rRNA (uracil1498-N3)-methyltransferase
MTRAFRQFHVPTPLTPGATVALPEGLQHRLRHVLRLQPGDGFHLFDGTTGRYKAQLADAKARTAKVLEQTDAIPAAQPFALLLGLPKREALESALRQATELGVTDIYPILTDYSVANRLNIDRALAITVEASEQCERLTLPMLHQPGRLAVILDVWHKANPQSTLAWADETAEPGSATPQATAVLVGPEGGFSPTEQEHLRSLPYIKTLTLGKTILRTDTAVVAALAKIA